MTALEEIKKALEAAEQFIVNGVELGYIRMPNTETPDSAHDTLPMIRQAQTALESLQRENEELRKDKDHIAAEKAGIARNAHNNVDYWKSQADAAEAEVKRLREALQNVMGCYDTPLSRRRFPPDGFMTEAINTARTALASTGGEHHAE